MERKEIGNLTDLSILSIEYNRENSHWEKEGIRNLADDLTIFRLKIYRSTLSNRDNRERHVPPFLASQNFPPSGTNTTDSIHTERRRCLIQISSTSSRATFPRVPFSGKLPPISSHRTIFRIWSGSSVVAIIRILGRRGERVGR